MATTSQQTRGNGLSSSLISDFRTIVSSLEQEKAGRDGGESGSADTAAAPAACDDLRAFGDVRSRIAALGDMSDVLAARPAARAEPSTPARADSSPQASRRRSFGSAARQPGESDPRRKRNASKDIITWQRLGLLAVFMAVVGGGAVLLQSLAAREEAKVAPEVIGNAAVASVALSPQAETQPAVALKPLELSGAAIQASVPPSPTPSVLAHGTAADNLPPIVLNASGRSSSASEPVMPASAVTAFAATDPVAPAAAAIPEASEDGPASGDAVPPPVPEAPPVASAALPESAPLPPARAPLREVAAATPAAPAAEAASAAAPAPAAIPAAAEPLPPGFGGDPVGTAVTRRAVTMRAAPKKGAAAIGNLPGGRQVELVTCQQWCEIVVDGKRAFVYKSFIDTGAVASSAGPATDEAGDAVEAEAPTPE